MKRTVQVIDQVEHLPGLKKGWDSLAEKQRNPLIGFDWFQCCAQTINREDQLQVVVIHEGGKIIAIAPLCLRTTKGLRRLESLGSTTLFEPTNFLYSDPDALAFLLRNVVQLGFPVALFRLPDELPWREVIDGLRWSIGPTLVSQARASTVLKLTSNWTEFVARLSSRKRNEMRRKRKRLDKAGTVTTKFFCPKESELSEFFNTAIVIENQGWKGSQGTSLLKNARLQRFFDAYARKAQERGTLRLCFLYVDEQPIAMQIAIVEYDAVWILKIGYDEMFARCSPGVVLSFETFRDSVEHNVSNYEFLGSEEPWQRDWPIDRRQYMNVMLFPYGWAGLRGLASFAGQILLNRVRVRTKGLFGKDDQQTMVK